LPLAAVMTTQPAESSLVIPSAGRNQQHAANSSLAKPLVSGTHQRAAALRNLGTLIHDIFEGTEQIQQLVISRAISGLRIE
jgi:hypothetical protein